MPHSLIPPGAVKGFGMSRYPGVTDGVQSLNHYVGEFTPIWDLNSEPLELTLPLCGATILRFYFVYFCKWVVRDGKASQ